MRLPSPLRATAAAHLRRLAYRLEPTLRRSPAPLVRLDGRWWHRGGPLPPGTLEELADGTGRVRPPAR
jgi:hypothetical protein